MPKDYLTEELPSELILLLPPSLSTASLNALVLTCRRLRDILQPELETRLTPADGRELLLWAAGAAKPHIVAKLLSDPHNLHPSESYEADTQTPLHVPPTSTILKLQHSSLRLELTHLAYGILTSTASTNRWASLYAALLLAHGADTEKVGVRGTALGFALCARRVDMVRLLLRNGAKAEVSVPLFRAKMFETEAPPYRANLLYLALALRPPRHEIYDPEPETPSDVGRTELVAMLLKHGARKDVAMNIVANT
ncbi:hypothetical protein B0H13DRAFT_2383453 [Mycena leptocephala]|nr:hypothetical protein B0H13DRAFT_2383453 [Mycena leptocephala]